MAERKINMYAIPRSGVSINSREWSVKRTDPNISKRQDPNLPGLLSRESVENLRGIWDELGRSRPPEEEDEIKRCEAAIAGSITSKFSKN